MKQASICVYAGEQLAHYGFGNDHPFSQNRFDAFWHHFQQQSISDQVQVSKPVLAQTDEIGRFHTTPYIDRVKAASWEGIGFLDGGDTPAFPGAFESASYVVGSVLDAAKRILAGECQRAFVPIAGLHHARRDGAAGFCIFNDCGVVIETLRACHQIRRIAYVDIDAHHGDGVFYAFEDDPDLIVADLHEDGRFLYPGTGSVEETGRGEAVGTKLNIPLPPYADDQLFAKFWPKVESFLAKTHPEFFILQCGADSLADDPLTHLQLSAKSHAMAARSLCRLADQLGHGRVLAVGGGGYNLHNLATAWTAVVAELLQSAETDG